MAVTVYLDASFLMLSAKFHVDIVSESKRLLAGRVQFAVPAPVLSELKGLAGNRGAAGRDARVALSIVREKKIPRVLSTSGSDADAALIEASRLPNTIIATADLELRRKIRNTGKPVMIFREKAKLELEGIEPAYW